MKLILFYVTISVIGLVHCRSPLTNWRYNNGGRSSTIVQSPSSTGSLDDEIHRRNLSMANTTITTPLTKVSTSRTNVTALNYSSHNATIKVVSAMVAKPSPSKTVYSSSGVVKVITADVLVDSLPELQTNQTAKNTTDKPILSFQDRLKLNNWDSTRSKRPTNSSQVNPKRTLLSESMSRYLAKARAITPATPTNKFGDETPISHAIVKRHAFKIPWMTLDDFVLDVEDKL